MTKEKSIKMNIDRLDYSGIGVLFIDVYPVPTWRSFMIRIVSSRYISLFNLLTQSSLRAMLDSSKLIDSASSGKFVIDKSSINLGVTALYFLDYCFEPVD